MLRLNGRQQPGRGRARDSAARGVSCPHPHARRPKDCVCAPHEGDVPVTRPDSGQPGRRKAGRPDHRGRKSPAVADRRPLGATRPGGPGGLRPPPSGRARGLDGPARDRGAHGPGLPRADRSGRPEAPGRGCLLRHQRIPDHYLLASPWDQAAASICAPSGSAAPGASCPASRSCSSWSRRVACWSPISSRNCGWACSRRSPTRATGGRPCTTNDSSRCSGRLRRCNTSGPWPSRRSPTCSGRSS